MTATAICWCGEDLEWEGSCPECQRVAQPRRDPDDQFDWMPGDPQTPDTVPDDLELPLAPLVEWLLRRGREAAPGVAGDKGLSTLASLIAARYGTRPKSEDRRIQRLLKLHREGGATVSLDRAERIVMALDWHPGFIWGDLYRHPNGRQEAS